MEKWYVAAKKADFYAIAQQYHISPVMARIIRNRGEGFSHQSGDGEDP